jgi:hypothetical protein
VDGARTLPQYRSALDSLLSPAVPLTDDETSALREVVRQRRNGRRSQAPTSAAPHVRARAGEIVALLAAAARELRPRETQQLDDLVAGRAPPADPPSSVPVRPRRNGWPLR